MSSKPKYYYDLSIYGPKNSSKSKESSVAEKPHGWYFPLGLGKHIISFAHSSEAKAQRLTTTGNELLHYASSLEGKVKLGFIASCTAVGGIVTLVLRPQGRIRKIFYPALFLATSSSICYPSNAYTIAKKAAIITYSGGEKTYNGAKVVQNKISEWKNAREAEKEKIKSDIHLLETSDSEPLSSEDKAPERNAPVMNYQLQQKKLDAVEDSGTEHLEPLSTAAYPSVGDEVEKEGVRAFELDTLRSLITPIGEQDPVSIEDPGQSSEEDGDLYTTRS